MHIETDSSSRDRLDFNSLIKCNPVIGHDLIRSSCVNQSKEEANFGTHTQASKKIKQKWEPTPKCI